MEGGFQMLHSNDLMWSHLVREYQRGNRPPIFAVGTEKSALLEGAPGTYVLQR